MNIEIRTDKNIHNSERLITYVRAELTQNSNVIANVLHISRFILVMKMGTKVETKISTV